MIEPDHPRLSIVRQCELASIGRSSFYRVTSRIFRTFGTDGFFIQ